MAIGATIAAIAKAAGSKIAKTATKQVIKPITRQVNRIRKLPTRATKTAKKFKKAPLKTSKKIGIKAFDKYTDFIPGVGEGKGAFKVARAGLEEYAENTLGRSINQVSQKQLRQYAKQLFKQNKVKAKHAFGTKSKVKRFSARRMTQRRFTKEFVKQVNLSLGREVIRDVVGTEQDKVITPARQALEGLKKDASAKRAFGKTFGRNTNMLRVDNTSRILASIAENENLGLNIQKEIAQLRKAIMEDQSKADKFAEILRGNEEHQLKKLFDVWDSDQEEATEKADMGAFNEVLEKLREAAA